MSEREWDEIFKDKLEGITAQQSSSDWDSLRERYLEVENLGFDTKVKAALDKHTIESSESGWEELRAILTHRKEVSRRIAQVKVLEILVVLLLCQGLYVWYAPEIDNSGYDVYRSDIPMASVRPVEDKASSATAMNQEDHSKVKIDLSRQVAEINSTKITDPIHVLRSTPAEPSQAIEEAFAISVHSEVSAPEYSDEIVESSSTVIKKTIPVSEQSTLDGSIEGTVFDIDNAGAIVHKDEALEHASKYKDLWDLDKIDPVWSHLVREVAMEDMDVDIRKEKSSELSAYVGLTRLSVQSPYDKVYDLRAYRKVASAYEFGMSYLKRRYRWKFGMGVNYHRFGYEPQRVYENLLRSNQSFENNRKIALKELTYHLVSIPLELAYNVYNGKKSSISLGLQIAPTFNLASRFDAVVANAENDDLYSKVLSGTQAIKSLDQEATFLAKKDFDEGLLLTGNFKNNTHLYGGLKLAYNYELNDDIGFYVAGQYSHPFSSEGLGPNEDKISKLSVSTGMSFFF